MACPNQKLKKFNMGVIGAASAPIPVRKSINFPLNTYLIFWAVKTKLLADIGGLSDIFVGRHSERNTIIILYFRVKKVPRCIFQRKTNSPLGAEKAFLYSLEMRVV